ncbi:hypothetical protein B0A55_09277 [Friedmanniomyces simplex]|uniref:Heterokaryon incompatibility domain-containing protein n=1 Tax=Friedmanniomyces simplex TaxID=329884 RepID=A0A4U0WRE1_9PEZI|nr:hypothetical protein B0A55_09277 [Friedmanniomyces simplex]
MIGDPTFAVGQEYHSWIFIDAICINQGDVEERSSQVALMGEVYRRANEVVVWLGSADKMLRLDGPAVTVYNFHSDLPGWRDGEVSHKTGLWQELLDEIRYGRTQEKSLIGPFIMQPFWSRLWVIQEIVLAKKLIYRYKSLRLHWEVLHECLKHLAAELWLPPNLKAGYASLRDVPRYKMWDSEPERALKFVVRALQLLEARYQFTY